MRQHQVRPKRDLGQNFLIDDNILGVISTLSELEPDDVVLEVGGGLGVLSEHLAPKVKHLHVIELDRALQAPLEEALQPFENATLHMADAVKIDLATLDPAPTVCVSNLPYSVAATVIIRTVSESPSIERWVGMVQKEVGQRFAAAPGSKEYGAPSALAQLSCDVKILRPLSRNIFSPVPNVDSVLLGLKRVRPPAPVITQKLISAAFLHRRKALPRTLSLAPGAPDDRRETARAALEQIGLLPEIRGERLSAEQFIQLTEAIATIEGDENTVAQVQAWRKACAEYKQPPPA